MLPHQIDLNMKKVLTFLLTILTAVSAMAADSLTVFYRIRLDQDIDQSSQRLVTLGLEKARDADADYVLLDLNTYGGYFDVVFMEGGILHYFHDINEFMQVMYSLLAPGGKLICSDFHPFTKIIDVLHLEQPTMTYFSTEIFEFEMAHARFYEEEIRTQMPKCLCRKYTISEIINAVIHCGFTLERFDEHQAWENPDVPGEFTIVAKK